MPASTTDLWRGHYYEELEVGQCFDAGAVTVTDAHLVAAARGRRTSWAHGCCC